MKEQWLHEECSPLGTGLEPKRLSRPHRRIPASAGMGCQSRPPPLHGQSQSQRGRAAYAAAQQGEKRAYWLNSISLPKRPSLPTATRPQGLEDHFRGPGPEGPEFKIHSSLRLGHSQPLTWIGVEALHSPLVALTLERLCPGWTPLELWWLRAWSRRAAEPAPMQGSLMAPQPPPRPKSGDCSPTSS